MNNELLTGWLNNMGAGTFLALIVFVIGIASSLTLFITKMLDKHRSRVEDETTKQIHDNELDETVKELITRVDNIDEKVQEIDQLHETVIPNVDSLTNQCCSLENIAEILIDSSKSSIKAYIISEYQKWMKRGYIDIYSLSVIEEQYTKYDEMHGNTFVKDMMVAIRTLPKRFYVQDINGKDPVGYFDKGNEIHDNK